MSEDQKDQQIDGALKALTTATPPDGLEDRVLRRLAQRKPKARVMPMWLVPALAMGAFALAIAFVGMRHHAVPEQPKPVVESAITNEPVPQKVVATQAMPHPFVVAPRKVRTAQSVGASFPAPEAPLTEQEKLLVRMALARQQAMVSAPVAPPVTADSSVPLTGQEKLLVAVSRVRQPGVIDALDPVRRAAEDAADDRQFQAFVTNVRPGGF